MSRELTDREARLRDDLIARIYIELRKDCPDNTDEEVVGMANDARAEAEAILLAVYPKPKE